MSAVDPLDELAFVLHGQGYCGEVCVCVDDARALLPVVDEIAGKRAAEELRAAGRDLYRLAVIDVPDWLHDRAEALDAEVRTSHPTAGHAFGSPEYLAALATLDADPTPEPVAHNHTRFRNDAGPWSPCPVSCPAAGLLR